MRTGLAERRHTHLPTSPLSRHTHFPLAFRRKVRAGVLKGSLALNLLPLKGYLTSAEAAHTGIQGSQDRGKRSLFSGYFGRTYIAKGPF